MPALLAWVALTGMTGCATDSAAGRHFAFQEGGTPPGCLQDCGGFGLWEKRDDFQLLQQLAGLEEDAWHEAGEELEPEEAQALWEALARTGTSLQSFGPRRSLLFVLRQVRTRAEDMPYAELLQRLRSFHFLVVMRPDGYLVSALTGRPLQRMGMGRVELREGRLMAGHFEVGAFYRDKGGVFYTVDDSLSRPGVMVGELGLERDWFNAALDGGGDALGEMAQALAQLVDDPIQSLQGLEQLPSAVAALIASSPEYFARYSALPLQEQIREAARLSTHLVMIYGSAAGTATRLGTAGARLPVLSLSAEGALAIEQVVVPVGYAAAALGTGAGAVYVLMESPKAPSEGAQTSSAAKGAGGGFKPFTEGNFRENLARLTGKMPEGAHAHHVFSQQFAKDFRKAGINVNDPKFGAWWERASHLKKAVEYNRRWKKFLGDNPSFEQILQFGRELGGEFGFQVNF
ncbi:hypothetical protein [Hyalangium sp.]|uniref:hypothetical protein n=1 Tax=Hyalangium sp. TaxID=2028555 RepID=UPI002D29D8EF|nr:hypothetical protein [Hyalangium sp.]HYI01583.1 hypothetical protein [Hyalangium sp.]